MLLGYATSGMRYHDLSDAIEVLAEIGYRSVAISLEHHVLNPRSPIFDQQVERVAGLLRATGLRCVIETRAPFALSPRHPAEPSLLTEGDAARALRVEYLRSAIDVAQLLDAEGVVLVSGQAVAGASVESSLERLADGLRQLLSYAQQHEVTLAVEPVIGMFIETTAHFERLLQWVDDENLQIALNISSLFRLGEVPIADYVRRWRQRTMTVVLSDFKPGDPTARMPGDGDMAFAPILQSFAEVDYRGPLHVRLDELSPNAYAAARQAFEFLSPLVDQP